MFAVTLSRAANVPVTVRYATADVTAKAGSDYAAASGTITFPAGSTRQEVAVTVTGDATAESDETFTVALSQPVGATLATAKATGTITNDDAPPAGQGVTAVFTVVNQWTGGFQGEVKIVNGGTKALAGWRLGFTAPGRSSRCGTARSSRRRRPTPPPPTSSATPAGTRPYRWGAR